MPATIDVAVVGGGPVGLLMGLALARVGLTVRVLERRTAPVTHSRAIGIHPPALDVLDAAGVGGAISTAAVRVTRGELRHRGQVVGALEFGSLPGAHRYVATLPQADTERLLAAALDGHRPGVLVRGATVRALAPSPGGVHLAVRRDPGDHAHLGGLADGAAAEETVRARWVVIADGAAGGCRGLVGIGSRARHEADRYLMGDFAADPADRTAVLDLGPGGVVESFPLPGGRRRWVAHLDRAVPGATAADLARIVTRRTGTPVDSGSATMLSAFGVRRRLVRRMVAGRVVVIGDAAHEVSPIGGQGMNLGWLDAAALAAVLARGAADPGAVSGLLDRFERDRMRAAGRAATRAGIYTRLGRAARPTLSTARAAALGVVLRGPARPWLAETFAMRRG